jgi:hypothetical protein
MSIEAMKQALEALEWNLVVIEDYGYKEQLSRQHKAIVALRQAIAEAEKQDHIEQHLEMVEQVAVALDVTLDEAAVEMLNAFSSPSPDLDDYSELRLMLGEGHSGYGLYLSLAEYPEEGSELLVNTHPPKREPLTDEQIATISVECATVSPSDIYFARAIEAAHGIKRKA